MIMLYLILRLKNTLDQKYFSSCISNSFEPTISSALPLNCSFGCSCLFGSSNFQQIHLSIILRFFLLNQCRKVKARVNIQLIALLFFGIKNVVFIFIEKAAKKIVESASVNLSPFSVQQPIIFGKLFIGEQIIFEEPFGK